MVPFESLRGLQGLDGACGSFGPVETERLGLPQPLVWQQQFGTRKGTTWLSLATPIAGLARFEGFEGFEGFEAFEAFGGSIRQFRASRKRKTWLATAASFAPTWLATASNLAAPSAAVAPFGSFGPVETERLGLPQPLVWQQQFGTRKGTTWLSLATPIASLACFEGFEGLKGLTGLKRLEGASGSFGPVEKERLGLPQPLVLHQKRNHLACHSL